MPPFNAVYFSEEGDAMSAHNDRPLPLSIEVEPDLHRQIQAAAAAQRLCVRDYVVSALRRAVEGSPGDRSANGDAGWAALSAGAFARDWDSDADAVYDDLA